MTRPLAALLALAALVSLGFGKDLPPDTMKRKDAILKLFADEFIQVTPGKGKFPQSFVMGTDKGGRPNEQPVHKVTFKYDFAMARYEVTQELYFVVMGKNPAKWKGPRNSVEMVDWKEAREFCDKAAGELRRLKLLATDEVIRLPSEAEWEYACRAGSTTLFSFGDEVAEIGKYCWYKVNAPGNDPPVGTKLGNAWGFHEMHGYVWEWCEDTGHDDYTGAPDNGSPWTTGDASFRIVRGGSYADPADACRSGYRKAIPADSRSDTIGFRCVRAKK